MRLPTILFGVEEALQNMVRNLGVSVASITTSAMSLLVLGLFLALSLNISHLSAVLARQVDARVFVADSCRGSCLAAMGRRLHHIPDVASVIFYPKAAALRNLEQQLGADPSLFQGLGNQNPLQNSFEVRARTPSEMASVVRRLSHLPHVTSVVYQARVVERLVAFISVVRLVGLIIGVLLAFGALLVIYNAIRVGIYARRREIHIMRLVGATEGFVRFPFLLEGTVLGAIGGGLAIGALALGYHLFFQDVTIALPFLPMLPPDQVVGRIAGLILIFGVLLGLIGSRISLQRVRV